MTGIAQLVIAFAFLIGVASADPQPWEALQDIKPDTPVRIVLTDGKTVSGSFVSWSPTSVTLDRDRTLPMEKVHRLEQQHRASRWRGAMIGGLVAFGIGFTIGFSKAGYLTDRNSPKAQTRIGIGSGFGMFSAAIGAPIGALVPGSKTTTVYVREGKP